MLIVDYDFDDVNTISRIVIDKFEREEITYVNQISKVCCDFDNSIEGFVTTLSVDTIRTYYYLNTTFRMEQKKIKN